MTALVNYYIGFGGLQFLTLPLYVLALYVIYKLLVFVGERFVLKSRRAEESSRDIKTLLKFLLRILGLGAVFALLIGTGVRFVIGEATAESVASNGNLLMTLDKKLFGVYPAFWFQNITGPAKLVFDAAGPWFIAAYNALSLAVTAVFFITLARGNKKFHQFFASFLLAAAISLPFWHFWPALSPLDGYLVNQTKIAPPEDIQREIVRYKPNQSLQNFLNSVANVNRDEKNSFFAVTTMPSMHVAWATVALYFGIEVWPPLAMILVPYFILNFAASVYTMQHYAVDGLAGMAVALAAIFAVKFFSSRINFAPEERTMTAVIGRDLAKARALLRKARFWS
ncbi:MAG: phosphatase PAP2 family protein [Parcubacteria group bacterium]|nr:phosphatase PAP2 family protein [Parcubacteria group bacterium]